ncbi:MAG: hypothetical protein U0Q07_02735 [Acidimicrobiales bacterium]
MTEPPATTPPILLATAMLPLGTPLQLPQQGAGWVHDRFAVLADQLASGASDRVSGWLGAEATELVSRAGTLSSPVVVTTNGAAAGLAGIADRVVARLAGDEGSVRMLDPEGTPAPVPEACWRSEFPRVGAVRRLDAAALAAYLDEGWQLDLPDADLFDDQLSARCNELGWCTTDWVESTVVAAAVDVLALGAAHADRLVVLVEGEGDLEVTGQDGATAWLRLGSGGAALVPAASTSRLHTGGWAVVVTFRLGRLLGRQLFERLAHEGGHWPLLRADVPYHLDRRPLSYERSVFDHDGDLAVELGEVAGPDLVERAVATRRARLRRPAPASMGEAVPTMRSLGAATRVHLPLSAPPMLGGVVGDLVILAFENQLVHLHAAAVEAFCALAGTSEGSTADDLPAVVVDGADQRRELVVRGLRAGVLRVAAP